MQKWGAECMAELDPERRRELVTSIINSGDPGSIPVLIDGLEEVKRRAKKPDRDPKVKHLDPHSAGPELWGLYVLTGQDFDLDIRRWRDWWVENQGKLDWDPINRRFWPKR